MSATQSFDLVSAHSSVPQSMQFLSMITRLHLRSRRMHKCLWSPDFAPAAADRSAGARWALRALSRSGRSALIRAVPPSFWLKTKNVVESELILLGTDYDNEGKPIAYLGKEIDGELQFAGTAFLTLTGEPKAELQAPDREACYQ